MPRVLLAVAVLSAGLSAGVAGSAAGRGARLEESFALRVGESALIEGEDVRVAFDGVLSDSRCPKGEQCLVEGDATIRILIQERSARTSHELHTSARAAQEAGNGHHAVRLVRLDPYPVAGKAIEERTYEATLQVRRGSSDPVSRSRP